MCACLLHIIPRKKTKEAYFKYYFCLKYIGSAWLISCGCSTGWTQPCFYGSEWVFLARDAEGRAVPSNIRVTGALWGAAHVADGLQIKGSLPSLFSPFPPTLHNITDTEPVLKIFHVCLWKQSPLSCVLKVVELGNVLNKSTEHPVTLCQKVGSSSFPLLWSLSFFKKLRNSCGKH